LLISSFCGKIQLKSQSSTMSSFSSLLNFLTSYNYRLVLDKYCTDRVGANIILSVFSISENLHHHLMHFHILVYRCWIFERKKTNVIININNVQSNNIQMIIQQFDNCEKKGKNVIVTIVSK
jgi:hypothetical protein